MPRAFLGLPRALLGVPCALLGGGRRLVRPLHQRAVGREQTQVKAAHAERQLELRTREATVRVSRDGLVTTADQAVPLELATGRPPAWDRMAA